MYVCISAIDLCMYVSARSAFSFNLIFFYIYRFRRYEIKRD